VLYLMMKAEVQEPEPTTQATFRPLRAAHL